MFIDPVVMIGWTINLKLNKEIRPCLVVVKENVIKSQPINVKKDCGKIVIRKNKLLS